VAVSLFLFIPDQYFAGEENWAITHQYADPRLGLYNITE
jgi:hypothetical protein